MKIEELILKYGLVKDKSEEYGMIGDIPDRYRWEDGIKVAGNAIGICEDKTVVFAEDVMFSKEHQNIAFWSWSNPVEESMYEYYIQNLRKKYDEAIKEYKQYMMKQKIESIKKDF